MFIFRKEMKNLDKKMYVAKVYENNPESKAIVDEKIKIIKNGFRYRTLFDDYNVKSIWQYGFSVWFFAQRLAYAYVLT